jgi:citrate lyase subunit beta/citryl-CoA lyase
MLSNAFMSQRPVRLRRSVLYVPASNAKAVAKSETLDADAIIYDLEDAVAPDAKEVARESLRAHFKAFPTSGRERVIRINALDSDFGAEDFLAARACRPDAILIPKVEVPKDIGDVADMLGETDAPDTIRLWAMMETPKAALNAAAIADWGETSGSRFDCMVIGTNDLAKDLRMPAVDRAALQPVLMKILVAARAFGLDVIDGVYNAFRDMDGFAAECAEGARMGFDGKTLIHPSQIEGANAAYGISPEREADARATVAAFDQPENRAAGVIALDGRMIERLHLEEARRTLALAKRQKCN